MKKILYIIMTLSFVVLLAMLLLRCAGKSVAPQGKEQKKEASIAPASILPGRTFKIVPEPVIPQGAEKEEGSYDMLVASLDASGKTRWVRTYGNDRYDWADYAVECGDGGILVLGRTFYAEEGQNDYYVMKLDSSGNSLWTRTFAGVNESPMDSVAQSVDGGYVIAGKTFSEEGGSREVYIARTDKDGNYEWVHNFGREYYDWGYTSIVATDGSYITVGQEEAPDINTDAYLRKRGNDGKYAWEKSYGGNDYDWAYSITGAEYGYVLAGLTYSYGAGNDDVYIVKVNENGMQVWDKYYGGPGYEEAFSICSGKDGFAVAGATTSWGSGGHDAYVIMVDAEGNSVWTSVFGMPGNDAAYSINRMKDGGFIIAGTTNSKWDEKK